MYLPTKIPTMIRASELENLHLLSPFVDFLVQFPGLAERGDLMAVLVKLCSCRAQGGCLDLLLWYLWSKSPYHAVALRKLEQDLVGYVQETDLLSRSGNLAMTWRTVLRGECGEERGEFVRMAPLGFVVFEVLYRQKVPSASPWRDVYEGEHVGVCAACGVYKESRRNLFWLRKAAPYQIRLCMYCATNERVHPTPRPVSSQESTEYPPVDPEGWRAWIESPP